LAASTFPTAERKPSESTVKVGGGAGSRIPPDDVGFDRSRSVSDGSSVADPDEVERPSFLSIGVDPFPGRKVENRPDAVREKLFCALAEWTMTRDARTLCRALLDVLSELDQPN
jgi:hypothetical protein